MPERPTGTVTFLFTDIEGSTERWERHGAWMAAAHARHEAILRAAIAAHGGWAYKQIGDAFQAAFQTAPAAFAAAVAAQQALAAEPWGEPGPLRVRMALHSGVAEERADDYVGPLLNRVARLLAAGHGGQILLTAAASELARDHLPAGVGLRDLGEQRLKDLMRPERVWQVMGEGLDSDFPPLKTLDERPNNLPRQLTGLIGREDEMAAITALLRDPDVALVTLTGPGGIGKTRLALEVAAGLINDLPHGAWFVDLSALTDPAQALPNIATALGVREEAGRPQEVALQDYLREKRLLLVLDNFEQILPAARAVAALLAGARWLKVLVTSRAPLRVRGERQFPVSPLAVPPRAPAASVAAVRQYAAVRLFIERAVAVRPDFVVTNAMAPAVAEICIRLDGLPLAIELAAARTKLLRPDALLARLSERLPALTIGARDLAARHQTLRGAIAWSYDLLSPAEQTLFRRLAAFVGGWTLDAAAQVAGGRAASADGDAADSGLPAALAPGSPTSLEITVLDGLAALVEQSLLWSREGRDGEPRFGMLETIREFAADRLQESGEAPALARIHMMFFTALAEQAEAELSAPQPVDWLDRLEEEHDNFRAALDWAEVSGAVETGLRIAMGLFEYWSARGYWSEGRARLARLLTGYRCLDNDFIRAKALMRASYLAYAQTDLAAAWALAQPAEAVFRRLDSRPELAECLRQLGQTAFARGDFGAGYTLVQESVDLFREIRRLPGGEGRLATALRTLGWGARERGEYKQARAALEESLSLARDLGHDMALMGGLRHLAVLERVVGDYGAASRLLEQSVETARRLDHVEGAAYGQLELARVRRWQGALPDAVALAADSLGLFRQLGDTWAAAACVAVLGGVAASAGHAARAVRLLGAAVTFTDAMGAPLFPEDRREHDGYLVTARASLDEARFAAAWAEGRRLTLEEAITEALAEAPPDA